METYYLDHDIRLCCISAASFPAGVMDAYQRLHNLFPDFQTRRVYGIAWPDGQGSMVYKAGVEESYPGEARDIGMETFVVKKGEYLGLLVKNFMDDIASIGLAFRRLVDTPGIHPDTIGIEMYQGDNVRCLVPLTHSSMPQPDSVRRP
jgi:hypothetical protein